MFERCSPKSRAASAAVLGDNTEETMKIRLLLTLVGLAISFALPTFAQQTNTPDPRLSEWLVALDKKHAEPWNKNDAAAVAALFTEDAVYVTDRGPVNGRQAIEKYFADLFQKMHFSNHLITVDQFSPHIIGTAGDEMWATGEWSLTIQDQNFGPVEAKGYWGAIKRVFFFVCRATNCLRGS
jgi:ketosteroid isomerase-like protein